MVKDIGSSKSSNSNKDKDKRKTILDEINGDDIINMKNAISKKELKLARAQKYFTENWTEKIEDSKNTKNVVIDLDIDDVATTKNLQPPQRRSTRLRNQLQNDKDLNN